MSFNKFYNLSTDNTLGGLNPSNYVAVSEKAIKDYVDNHSGGGGTVDQTYDSTSTNAQSGTAVAEALTGYVDLNTSQKIQAAKAIFGNDVAFGSDTTQKNLLAVISNSNSTAGNWIGRLAVGAKNKTFIMGTYGGICVLGAHAWTNAQEGTGAAWEPVYINPDGDKAVYIGGSPINGKQPLMVLQNVNANTTGTVKINRSTNLSNNFKDVACWGDNISKFNNDAKFLKNNSTNTAGTSYIIGGTASGVSNAVCVGSSASTSAYSVVVGQGASSTALYSTAIGSTADSNSQFGTAIGYAAKAKATSAIQLGTGTNTDSNTLSIGFSDAATNYQLLDGTTGLIPDARLSTNIQRTLVSGTSIKTINSTSLLGSGNIDTSEIFIATYGTTTYAEVLAAYNAGKTIITGTEGANEKNYAQLCYIAFSGGNIVYFDFECSQGYYSQTWRLSNDNTWESISIMLADTSLSNLSTTGKKVLDGQWTYVKQEICQGRTSETSDKSWTLSLPSDSCNYEVLLTGAVTTGTTSGNQTRIGLQSTIITTNIVMCNAQTRTSSSMTSYGACILPVGSNHKLTVSGWANNTGAYSLWMRGYRRIGTNS